MKHLASAVALSFGALACSVAANAQSAADDDFVRRATLGNEQEIRDARLQLRTGTAPAVRTFAQLMIDDHALALVKLRIAARDAHVPAAAMPPLPRISSVDTAAPPGPNAALAYFRLQVADHRQMLALLQSEATGSGAVPLKQWASDEIPVVQHHLALAEVQVQAALSEPAPVASP